MVFSSYLFLFVFLPIFFSAYYASPRILRNLTALIASYLFYAWGAPTIVPLLLASSVLDYWISTAMTGVQRTPRARRRLFFLGIVINLSGLFYFKYANFFIAEVNRAAQSFGGGGMEWISVALPIGISFFTFQKISYLADVYQGKVAPASRLLDYLLYVALFPQLIAGPIVRYHDIHSQLRSRRISLDDVTYGLSRFCIGLGKKVLIADEMGRVADNIFGLASGDLTMSYSWLGACAYCFQIYFDFSGYSDMAIGLGRMMGFRLLENFNMPYISESITEVWQRWHISLSNWMKEYVYVPLGGNRISPARTYLTSGSCFSSQVYGTVLLGRLSFLAYTTVHFSSSIECAGFASRQYCPGLFGYC